MPWLIKKNGTQYVVVKKTTGYANGEVKARFSTRARALSYLKALYANVKE